MGVQTKVTGVILAGGLARRMNNQDKGLVNFKGQPMVAYAIAAMGEVVDQVIINANRNIHEYEKFALPVICDHSNRFDGPLAGILAGMTYTGEGILLVTPCDSPLVRAGHLRQLLTTLCENDADIAVADDGERLHPVFLAIKANLRPSLQDYLQNGHRKVETWLKQHNVIKVDFSTEPNIFFNINNLQDLVNFESLNHTVQD